MNLIFIVMFILIKKGFFNVIAISEETPRFSEEKFFIV
jgi:hypothetical protein